MVAAKDRRHAFSGFTLNRRAVRFMKALPFPWNVFTPAPLTAQAPGAPGVHLAEQGQVPGFI